MVYVPLELHEPPRRVRTTRTCHSWAESPDLQSAPTPRLTTRGKNVWSSWGGEAIGVDANTQATSKRAQAGPTTAHG